MSQRNGATLRKVGRPAATDREGNLQPVSKLPKLTIYMTPETKAKLNIVSQIQKEPVWRIIEQAVSTHLKTILSQDQSKAIEKLLSS
jgi:aspartyl aminopeptidase